MPAPIDDLSAQYILLGKTIDSSFKRMSNRVGDLDEEALVLQGVYLFGVRAFESFLEAQMVHLCHSASAWGPKHVNGKLRQFVRKVSNDSPIRARELLTMGSLYADYLPYDRAIAKAKVLFANGRPFSILEPKHKEIINRSYVVRNLIAHESEYAIKRFKKVVCSRYPLRPDKRNASGYLVHEAIKGLPMVKQDLAGLFEAATFLS